MNRIPEHIIEHHKQGVENLRFYGVPVTELNRDELLAFAGAAAETAKQTREQLLRMSEMRRALGLWERK